MNRHLVHASALCGTVLLTAGIAWASGGKAHWSYSGEGGPANWGHLSPDFVMCGKGKNQSPVDLNSMVEAELQPISFSYAPAGLDVVNNGHTIKASIAPGSSITVDGHRFDLLQVHWHTPSENTVNGKSFPMEAHLVHGDSAGNLAVVSVLYNKGQENKSISSVWEQMPAATGGTSKNKGTQVMPSAMLPADRDYYRFNGSLTTPPCTEGVLWLVMKNPVEASGKQIEKFHGTFHHDTNRPVQPANARVIMK